MWHVFGHSKAVALMERSIKTERLAHAYLITGPPHTGKMAIAINLAQALNCQQSNPPCNQCGTCRRISTGMHPDVQIISRLDDGSSTLKKEIIIGQIRELQQSAALQPYEGKYRIYIINGAEYMNEESSNRLLKTLEEPPANVMIILLSANIRRLLPTIVSRCHLLELLPVNPSLIEKTLIERYHVPPESAKNLSRLSNGAIGWAISAAEDSSILRERFSKQNELLDIQKSSITRRLDYAARLATQFSKERTSVEETLQLWLEWWRDLLLLKVECPQLVINSNQISMLQDQSDMYNLDDIRKCIEAILNASEQLAQNVNPRLSLEVLMLSMPHSGNQRILSNK